MSEEDRMIAKVGHLLDWDSACLLKSFKGNTGL
jgi:hypothetical protein